jgi:hypothetical protein
VGCLERRHPARFYVRKAERAAVVGTNQEGMRGAARKHWVRVKKRCETTILGEQGGGL